jgi:arylsulfatase A-like enzyme
VVGDERSRVPLIRQMSPNILIIYTDDQRTEDMNYMPFLKSNRDDSHSFRRYYHTLSQCCPSRTSMLTGMYPHNSKIEGNKAPEGGYRKYVRLNLENKTWARRLRAIGYRTVIAGKFLNGYPQGSTETSLGWWDWFVSYGFEVA